MAGLSDIVDSTVSTFPSTAPLANALGYQKTIVAQPELPSSDMRYAEDVMTRNRNPLFGIPTSTQPTDLPSSIPVYRGSTKTKNGLETMPLQPFTKGNNWGWEPNNDPDTSTFSTNAPKAIQNVYKYSRLNGAADSLGYPALDPEHIGAFVLKEGRSDLGYNGGADGSPRDIKYRKQLAEKYNLPQRDIDFLGVIKAKQEFADRKGIPFAEAWNGTGKNAYGQTGAEYARDWEIHREAALHPKNQQLMDLIQRGYEDGRRHGFPLRDNALEDSKPHQKKVAYKHGGVVKAIEGNSKLI